MLITYISGYDIRRWCRMNSNDDSRQQCTQVVTYIRCCQSSWMIFVPEHLVSLRALSNLHIANWQ